MRWHDEAGRNWGGTPADSRPVRMPELTALARMEATYALIGARIAARERELAAEGRRPKPPRVQLGARRHG